MDMMVEEIQAKRESCTIYIGNKDYFYKGQYNFHRSIPGLLKGFGSLKMLRMKRNLHKIYFLAYILVLEKTAKLLELYRVVVGSWRLARYSKREGYPIALTYHIIDDPLKYPRFLPWASS